MVDIQTISVVIAAASVVFGVITWVLQSRENTRTNQARLFMQIFDHYNDPEFLRSNAKYFHEMLWKDNEDF